MEEVKARGNAKFAQGEYVQAVELYDAALGLVDRNDARGRAVLCSNMAACALKDRWVRRLRRGICAAPRLWRSRARMTRQPRSACWRASWRRGWRRWAGLRRNDR